MKQLPPKASMVEPFAVCVMRVGGISAWQLPLR